MPAILHDPPAPNSYNFVLRRYDLSCVNAQTWATYDETTTSRAIFLDGVEAHTLFLRTKPSADRAAKLGWCDVTAQWLAHLEATTVKPTTDVQRKILVSLCVLNPDHWHSKGSIMDGADIVDSEWRTAIQYLEKLGLVECNMKGKKRASASNRSFRYKPTDLGREALEA